MTRAVTARALGGGSDGWCGRVGHAWVCAHAVQAWGVRGSGANREATTSWRARERGAGRAGAWHGSARRARARVAPCARVREPGRAHGSRAARLSSAWRAARPSCAAGEEEREKRKEKRGRKKEKEKEMKKMGKRERMKRKGGGRCAPAATAVGHAWRRHAFAGHRRWGTRPGGEGGKGEREKEGARFAVAGRDASRWMGKDGT